MGYIIGKNSSITLHKSRHVESFPNRWEVPHPRTIRCTRTHPSALFIVHIAVVERALQVFPVYIFFFQSFGELCHAPVLVSEVKSHRTSLRMRTFSRWLRHKSLINVLLHKITGICLIAYIITDTTRLRILQTTLISGFYIKIADSLIIGSRNERSGLITHHHISIITTTGAASNHPAIRIIIH